MSIKVGHNKPQWIPSGTTVSKGDLIVITASGTVKVQGERGRDIGPEGEGQMPPDNNFVRSDLSVHGLIATISESAPPVPLRKDKATQVPFLVGDKVVRVAEASGELYFIVNDNVGFFGDNKDAFDVTVEVTRSCSKSGTKTSMVFKNETSETVELLWVNYQCEEQSYGDIGSNQQKSMNTYTTHPWRIRNKVTQELLPIETPNGDQVYTYTNGSTSKVTVTVRG